MRERVLVAMSGGVDSSVAAALLVRQGYDVVGATMKLFCHGDDVPDRPCCSLDSVNDARRICEQLGIPHYVLNLESAFGHDVVRDFVDEYARGRTPIPCAHCIADSTRRRTSPTSFGGSTGRCYRGCCSPSARRRRRRRAPSRTSWDSS